MKMNNAQSFVEMEKDALQQLCKEVKESLATDTDIKAIAKHPFSVADLWKIQKNTRYRVQRRNMMY
jgi:hypothetical protein